MLIELEALLRARRASGRPVLVVDEAQSLPAELLEEIRLLANIERRRSCLLIIAGQPELAERLNDQSLRQLKRRIALRCNCSRFRRRKPPDISRQPSAAGGAGRRCSPAKRSRIHDRSQGIPAPSA